jgi:ATP-dependent DNA helicase DinG
LDNVEYDNEEKIYLDTEAIVAELEEGGAVAVPSYEKRQGQVALMRLVIQGFNEDAIVAAEAGTGIGKSFAYLLPSIAFSILNEERVIVSTATITLQQQLFEKDVPLVIEAMNQKVRFKNKFKAAVMKGRNNYLCMRRLDGEAKERLGFMEEEEGDLQAIYERVAVSKTGVYSDLGFPPDDKVWARVCSEADDCMGVYCAFKERCFVMRAKREAAEAQVVIVNHHLLFADLAARGAGAGYDGSVILPAYRRVIIDEAHAIEQAASAFFTEKFSRQGVYKHMGRLLRRYRANRQGLLPRLGLGEKELDALEDGIKSVREAADAVDVEGVLLCGGQGAFRFTKKIADVTRLLKRLSETLTFFVLNARDCLKKAKKEKDTQDNPVMWEIDVICRRLDGIIQICEAFMFFDESPEKVFWLEKQGDFTQWNIAPIDAAPILRNNLFKPNKTVVCVSATLAVAGGWDYWKRRCGLEADDGRTLTGIYPSPFPYASNVLLAVAASAPLPNEYGYEEFVNTITPRLVSAARGSSLVLFTSRESLKSAFAAASPILAREGIVCLKQGDAERTQLLHEFLNNKNRALFAVDSFWEGIDAPGDALRLVILCRLPFRTIGEPIFQAHCEYIEKQGRSSFMELSIPGAVMKFKQGFGRLIRRSTDYGVVVVLDGRLNRKGYGKYFLNSLPKTQRLFAGQETIVLETERFLRTFSPANTAALKTDRI